MIYTTVINTKGTIVTKGYKRTQWIMNTGREKTGRVLGECWLRAVLSFSLSSAVCNVITSAGMCL